MQIMIRLSNFAQSYELISTEFNYKARKPFIIL